MQEAIPVTTCIFDFCGADTSVGYHNPLSRYLTWLDLCLIHTNNYGKSFSSQAIPSASSQLSFTSPIYTEFFIVGKAPKQRIR